MSVLGRVFDASTLAEIAALDPILHAARRAEAIAAGREEPGTSSEEEEEEEEEGEPAGGGAGKGSSDAPFDAPFDAAVEKDSQVTAPPPMI